MRPSVVPDGQIRRLTTDLKRRFERADQPVDYAEEAQRLWAEAWKLSSHTDIDCLQICMRVVALLLGDLREARTMIEEDMKHLGRLFFLPATWRLRTGTIWLQVVNASLCEFVEVCMEAYIKVIAQVQADLPIEAGPAQ